MWIIFRVKDDHCVNIANNKASRELCCLISLRRSIRTCIKRSKKHRREKIKDYIALHGVQVGMA